MSSVMLGTLRFIPWGTRAAGLVLVILAALLWVRAQVTVARLRDEQAHSRWASNARDVIAAFGAFGIGAGFYLCGLPIPAAVLFAATLGVILELLRRGSHPKLRYSLLVMLVLSVAVALFPGQALAGANSVARWLFHPATLSVTAAG